MKNTSFLVSLLAAALLAACGGGSGSSSSTQPVTSVKVVGASLSDSGAFGYKFTVQPGGSTTYPVYSEILAANYGISGFCNFFSSPDGGTTWSTNSGCTNYAVAGSRVNYTTGSTVHDDYPVSIIAQLATAASVGIASTDLVIVGEGSSNDAATLTTAYLTDLGYVNAGHPELATAFATLVGTLGISGSVADAPTSGVAYMQALADKQVNAIEAYAFAASTPRVAVVNILDVTLTPRFQAVLGTLGSSASAVQGVVRAWISAYNTRLAADVAAATHANNMVVVDLYTGFNREIGAPTAFGLNPDVASTVCDMIYTGGAAPGVTGLDTPAVVAACTDTNAAALGLTGGWQNYLFADSFHPTPYGHQLLSLVYFEALSAKGWN